MEAKVAEILENILSMLNLEGSFDVEETADCVFVSIETQEAAHLIGHQGETLASLQLLINLIVARQNFGEEIKRVIVDVSNWRKGKEEELAHKARGWAQQVLDTGESMDLPPMPAWQRRIVHMTIEGTTGVKSESLGEGMDRHLIVSLDNN